jgi:pimeloyl-ACP methyl ester carboxylesterase
MLRRAPLVQYTTTADGVRIAYTVAGEGPPVLILNEPTASHVELEWSQPIIGDILARLAERVTVVRLDMRATGLSERVSTPGTDPVMAEVDAVIARLELQTFSLVGVQAISPAAVIYAARHPEQVTRLALIDPSLRVADMVGSPQLVALMTAALADWTIATEAFGVQVFGVGRAESQTFGAYIRACIDPEFYRVALMATSILDATSAAPDVRVPTLVVRHKEHPFVTADIAGQVAAAIAGAGLVTVPGRWADDPAGLADRVLDWMLEA